MKSSTEYLLQIYSKDTKRWLSVYTRNAKKIVERKLSEYKKRMPFFKLRIVRRVTTERVMT